jgi:single-stranded-DNA-specific exonuclease
MHARWNLKPFDSERILALSRGARISPLAAQLLINRGIENPARAVEYLETRMAHLHDPELIAGVVEAAERIVRAVRDGRKIVIYGDYDVDGVCGTSILWMCLKLAGARDVEYYIPHRVEEGYGVNAEALRRLATERGAALVVTVDCGISAEHEAEQARKLGIEFIVTDHHTIGSNVPVADAVVHPRLNGSRYPNPDLCGAGVAFKLAWQVCKSFGDGKRASPHMRDYLLRALGLVALATVADMVPLSAENRILVRHGLAGIASQPTVGLRALMEVSGCLGRKRLSTGTIGFALAPRINAAGRLERAMLAVEMLTTEQTERASALAQELNLCNARRQEIERSMVDEAHEMIKQQGGVHGRGAIVLGREGWHAGVIGIVAGRLAETYHRPAVVFALGGPVAQGSARSVTGFDLYEAIKHCSEGLIAYGGHAAAAGLKLAPERLAAFAEQFDQHCRKTLTHEQLERAITIDAEVLLPQLTLPVVEEIEKLEPYGIGNPRPVFLASDVVIDGQPRAVGEQQNHLQLRVRQNDAVFKAIAWNMAEKSASLTPGVRCSLVFHASVNEWQSRRDVQLEVKDFALEA